MALTDDVLENFFKQPAKNRLVVTPSTLKTKNSANSAINNDGTLAPKNPYRNYRVFDNPQDSETKTNLGQTKDKLKTQQRTNTRQTQDKHKTNLRQKLKTQDKLRTQYETEHKTNLRQTQDKPRTNTTFLALVGLQRNIALFMYEACKAARDKITAPLSIEHIALSCKTTKSSAQKTIQRLEYKGVVKRAEIKNGRGGWTRYELPEFIFQEILHAETQDKFRTNTRQNWDKIGTEPRTELKTTSPSSGSFNIYKKTTTTGDDASAPFLSPVQSSLLSEEWLNLDIEPLSEIGFSKTHLMQIATQNKLTTVIVQDSINAFAFDLKENGKGKAIKGDPINFFMGILRNGKPYAPPSNYESPQDKAMRIYLEKMREIEKKRADNEKELFELTFSDWFLKLTDDQKRELLPEMLRKNADLKTSKFLENSARSHFEKQIWAIKRSTIIEVELKHEDAAT